MRRLSFLLPAAALAALASLAPVAPLASGCAAVGPDHAALVVEHGDGSVVTRCVAFAAGPISGEELLNESGVAWSGQTFAGFGEAVCALDGEPAQYAACPGKDSYWAVFVARGGGAWQLSSVGISSLTLGDGDAEGIPVRARLGGTGGAGRRGGSVPRRCICGSRPVGGGERRAGQRHSGEHATARRRRDPHGSGDRGPDPNGRRRGNAGRPGGNARTNGAARTGLRCRHRRGRRHPGGDFRPHPAARLSGSGAVGRRRRGPAPGRARRRRAGRAGDPASGRRPTAGAVTATSGSPGSGGPPPPARPPPERPRRAHRTRAAHVRPAPDWRLGPGSSGRSRPSPSPSSPTTPSIAGWSAWSRSTSC